MSSWHEYEEEKAKIDGMIGEGYLITGVLESLEGDTVRFTRISTECVTETEELLLLTADARKYLGSVLIEQIRDAFMKSGPVT